MPDNECPAPVYANSVVVSVSGYDVFIRFIQNIQEAVAGPDALPNRQHTVTCVNLSHGLAWALAHIILVNLEKTVDSEGSAFIVPKDVIQRLGLEKEYAELQFRLSHKQP